MSPPALRTIRSFAMRRGHITQGQQRAFDAVYPKLAVPLHTNDAGGFVPLHLPSVFGREAPVVLEIGFGMGETTAAIAAAHPDIDFLGVEVFVAGIGALCKRVDALGLANVRIIQADAVGVVNGALPEASLAGVHVYFPDPWPKARHHKRRLVAQPFVGQLATRMARGAYLHCATDWAHYAEHMLAVLSEEALLKNRHDGFAPDQANPRIARPTTKFHARGERLGHGVWDLVFTKT